MRHDIFLILSTSIHCSYSIISIKKIPLFVLHLLISFYMALAYMELLCLAWFVCLVLSVFGETLCLAVLCSMCIRQGSPYSHLRPVNSIIQSHNSKPSCYMPLTLLY